MLPAVLLAVVLLANYAPEVMSGFGFGTLAAWFVVWDNAQLAALWWIVGKMAEVLAQQLPEHRPYLVPTLAVCSYGIFEAAQVPICRFAFPMYQPPPAHPEGICGAAGVPTYDLAPVLIAMCAVLVSRTLSELPGAKTSKV